MPIAFELLARTLLANAGELLPSWFPNGHREGREFVVGNLAGEKGDSLKINLDSGKWADFATDDSGGDLIALFAAMRGIKQSEAARQLGAEEEFPRGNGADHDSETLALPPPPVRPPKNARTDHAAFRHPRWGIPTYRYFYRDTAGTLAFVVARYEDSSGKHFSPFTWNGERWQAKSHARPRPLYGLERLPTHARRVVVVEGEKAADALQGVLKLSPVITWPGGAMSHHAADWTPLAGRAVLLWPDADPPGVKAMQSIAAELLRRGCTVTRVDTEGLTDGYDAADLIASGVTGDALNTWLKARMRPVALLERVSEPTRVDAPPEAAGALTIEQEPPPHTPEEVPPDYVPRGTARPAPGLSAYMIAQRYGLRMGSRGAHQNMSNGELLVAGMIEAGELPALWYDDFLRQVRGAAGEWTDRDTLQLLARVQRDMQLEKMSRESLDQAVQVYAWSHHRNCAKEWLEGLQWDGAERLSSLLPAAFGAERTRYTEAVGRCFIMGMAARLLTPGAQVDNLPVFEGPQGIAKTRALRALGGPWYAEVIEPVTSKDFYLSLAGKMLVEIAEFSSFKRSEAEAIRAAITRTTDRFRAPFERRAGDHPRQCVFAATTNDKTWNRDPTGARRFWPVRCAVIQVKVIEEWREQLFAEAAHRLRAGELWWDVPEEAAKREQAKRYDSDSIARPLAAYADAHADFTTLEAITYGLGLEGPQRYDRNLARRVDAQLIHSGYVLEPATQRWRRPTSPPGDS